MREIFCCCMRIEFYYFEEAHSEEVLLQSSVSVVGFFLRLSVRIISSPFAF
jgi:hypothetical protein